MYVNQISTENDIKIFISRQQNFVPTLKLLKIPTFWFLFSSFITTNLVKHKS